jgi:hypothetical protein
VTGAVLVGVQGVRVGLLVGLPGLVLGGQVGVRGLDLRRAVVLRRMGMAHGHRMRIVVDHHLLAAGDR